MKASENPFPGILIRESANDGSDFSNPAADYRVLFVGEDGLFHLKDSAGTVTTPGGTTVATDAIWDAAGDLVQGTGANTAARVALGTAGQVLKVNSGATGVEWGAAGGAGISGSVLVPSSDTYIDSQAATTNQDAATALIVGNAWGSASFTRFALLTFDTSALAGKTIYSAHLVVVRIDTNNAAAAGRRLEVRRVLRAYNPTQATWNVYSTGNNWTTAGGQSSGNDISGTADGGPATGAPATIPAAHHVPCAWVLKESLDAAETTLRLMLGANFDGSGSNQMQFASLENATANRRPYMLILHS